MRYPNSSDPDMQRFLRIRSAAGGVILLAAAASFTVLAVVSPPAPEHLSVNCIDVPGATLSDAAPDLTGCEPRREARPTRVRKAEAERLPSPSQEAKADDPPIPTF